MSLDSIYNSKSNRKAIFNRNMIPNIKLRQCDLNREGRKQLYNPDIFQERFRTIICMGREVQAFITPV